MRLLHLKVHLLPSSCAPFNTIDIAIANVPAASPNPTPVILVTLNHPRKYNAFTKTMEEELVRVYNMFNVDDCVKCVVLTGACKIFCAGADLDIGFGAQRESGKESEYRDGSLM